MLQGKRKKKAILKACPSHSCDSKPFHCGQNVQSLNVLVSNLVHDEESSKSLGGWVGWGLQIQDLAETAGYLGGILQEHPLSRPLHIFPLSFSPPPHLFSAVGY